MLPATHTKFRIGDTVRKIKGSNWRGQVVGYYSTTLTPEGYAVESSNELGSVQIYPAAALELLHRHKPKATKTLYQWCARNEWGWFIPDLLFETEEDLRREYPSAKDARRLDHTAIEVPA